MKRIRHTAEQIIRKLKTAEQLLAQGKSVADVCRALEVSQPTKVTATTAYIEPGSPWQNGFAESFNSRFRDEFLNTELFATVAEAQGLANRWRWEYNTLRPHSALKGRTPLEAAQAAAA